MAESDPSRVAVRVTVGPSHNSQTVIASGGKTITTQQQPFASSANNYGVHVAQPSSSLQPLISVLQAITKKQELELRALQDTSKPASEPTSQPVRKFNVNVKIFNPDKKSKSETYVLRDVSNDNISTPLQLRKEIALQFGRELVCDDHKFPVGYMKGSRRVWIRTEKDIEDIWSSIMKGDTVSFWCEGVSEAKKIEISSSDDEEDYLRKPKRKRKKKERVSRLKEKNEKIEEYITELRQKHGDKYNSLQYRMWGEMLDVGTYKSMEEPPRIPMFSGREKKPGPVQALSAVVTEMAKAMTSPKTPSMPSTSDSVPASIGISPGKVANLRASYLQQMKDLHSLFENGAINEVEYKEQKLPILDQLKKLTS